MGFGEAIRTCFSKYFTFAGRAQRSEYWFFYLFTTLVSIVLAIVDAIIGLAIQAWADIGVFGSLFSLAVFFPTIAAACRRLHDTNRSGWWQILPIAGLLLMIPGFIGLATGGEAFGVIFIVLSILAIIGLAILLIVWLATDSDKGPNRFGASPKYDQIEETFS